MKKYLLLIFAIITSLSLTAQELLENKVDDFTKKSIKRTSWEKLMYGMSGTAFFRISKIDDNYYFDLKLMNNRIFSIPENAELMFKLENDSIYSISNIKYAITEKGAGAIGFAGSAAYGIQTSYISKNDWNFSTLKKHIPVKFRIYTSDGYIEEEIKPKFVEKIANCIKLVE